MDHGQAGNEVRQSIEKWYRSREIDAVIWTSLKSNFKEKRDKDLDQNRVVENLRTLGFESKKKAEEYIRKAPEQIQTRIRRKIELELGWTG